MVGLGDIMGDPDRDMFESTAIGVSGNGRIVVGHVRYGGPYPLSPIGYYAAARWIDGGTSQMLPSPPDLEDSFFARALSANGAFVAGTYDVHVINTINDDIHYSYRWSADGGYTILLKDKLTWFDPRGISDNGLVIVGQKYDSGGAVYSQTAIWTPDGGLRLLKDFLLERGINTGELELSYAQGISADGRVIVGYGQDISGKTRGYRVALWELPPRKIIVNSVADRPALSPANCCDTGEKLPNGDVECTLRAAP
jgi:probable HAF family extracellular repeat protein